MQKEGCSLKLEWRKHWNYTKYSLRTQQSALPRVLIVTPAVYPRLVENNDFGLLNLESNVIQMGNHDNIYALPLVEVLITWYRRINYIIIYS